MPPQSQQPAQQNNNQMPPVSPSPSPSQSQSGYKPSGAGFSVDSLQKNPRFMTTIKTFAIYGTIVYVINAIVGMIVSSLHFSQYYNPFNVGALIVAIVVGIIAYIIGGAIFYFIYDPIHNWVKRTPFLSRYIHDMFTLMWKPYLVVIIITAVFALLGMLGLGAAVVSVGGAYGATSFGGLFIGWVISFVVQIAVYYWYAKQVSAKLEPLYPW